MGMSYPGHHLIAADLKTKQVSCCIVFTSHMVHCNLGVHLRGQRLHPIEIGQQWFFPTLQSDTII